MLLHGTNQKLSFGSLITSSGTRKAEPSFNGSLSNAVYVVDTEYTPQYNHIVTSDSDPLFYDDDAADGIPYDSQALSSAIGYAIDVAEKRGLHPESRYEGDGINALNSSWSGDQDDVPPVRGIWVYEVEQIGGVMESDPEGWHQADMRIPDGELKIVGCVIWDGALVDDLIDLPPISGNWVKPDDVDWDSVEDWYKENSSLNQSPKMPFIEKQNLNDRTNIHQCGFILKNNIMCARQTLNGFCWQHR